MTLRGCAQVTPSTVYFKDQGTVTRDMNILDFIHLIIVSSELWRNQKVTTTIACEVPAIIHIEQPYSMQLTARKIENSPLATLAVSLEHIENGSLGALCGQHPNHLK